MCRKKWLLAGLIGLPLTAAGLVLGNALVRADQPETTAGFVCPLTGEELPCPRCCPINDQ